jgi:hypothetical protein
MAKKKSSINVHKIIGNHPVIDEPIDLKWYRGACRYNNGATLYGTRYRLRQILAYNKEKPYTEQELRDLSAKQ